VLSVPLLRSHCFVSQEPRKENAWDAESILSTYIYVCLYIIECVRICLLI